MVALLGLSFGLGGTMLIPPIIQIFVILHDRQ